MIPPQTADNRRRKIMIEIEIKDTILICEQDLISFEHLSANSTDREIEKGVHDYILGMDDKEYYYVITHEEEIVEKIKKYLKNA